jgi:Na+/phosphate symporter
MTNADIFETMEKEMKQIMELFAKERKSRKKELTKLQAQVDQKNQQIDTLNKEKEEIM